MANIMITFAVLCWACKCEQNCVLAMGMPEGVSKSIATIKKSAQSLAARKQPPASEELSDDQSTTSDNDTAKTDTFSRKPAAKVGPPAKSAKKMAPKLQSKKKHNKRVSHGFFGRLFQRTSPEDEYRLWLEAQVKALEVVIRTVKEETRQLRHKLSAASLKSIRNSYGSEVMTKSTNHLRKQLEDQRAQFEKEIERLLAIIDELEGAKVELELALEQERQLTKETENLLDQANKEAAQIRSNMEKEMQIIQSSSSQQSETKLANLKDELSMKFNKELERMTTKHMAALEEERKRADIAVEAERSKMRKLVKAVAEKEGAVKNLKKPKKAESANTSSMNDQLVKNGGTRRSATTKDASTVMKGPTVTGKRT
jgi:DNA repair exonuclease SbcCD ATPase subunit